MLKPFTALEIDKALAKSFALAEANRSDRTPAPDAQPSGLTTITRREAQVLLLLGKGMQQQEVAEKLALSLRTVKMYRAFLKNKLGLNTLVEIGRFCEINRAAIAKIAE